MHESDWEYAGEGGKNVIFRYQPKQEIRKEWLYQHLLRLRKDDLALCSVGVTVAPYVQGNQQYRRRKSKNQYAVFHSMIVNKLAPYANLPIIVELDWDFLRGLKDRTLSTNKIPPFRREDWFADDNNMTKFARTPYNPHGMILPDYRFSVLRSRNLSLRNNQQRMSEVRPTEADPGFSIEIKPKAGYRAFSPLVDQSRSMKYLCSRFSLQQQLYSEGTIVREWMVDSSKQDCWSLYDPIDLFSENSARIKHALICLFDCPQNNLKIWNGRRLVFGSNMNSTLLELAKHFVGDASHRNTAEAESHVKSRLIEVISVLLQREPLLAKIHSLQRLDILDADGAILIYDHLVRLCDGDRELAESIVDSIAIGDGTSNPIHHILESSPFLPPDNVELIRNICCEISEFEAVLESSYPSLPPEDTIAKARKRTKELITHLNINDCRFLLQTWLLSLTICDISVFITFESCPVLEPADDRKLLFVSTQQEDEPGIVRLGEKCFWYKLNVIDFDGKPSKKIRSRLAKEEKFTLVRGAV